MKTANRTIFSLAALALSSVGAFAEVAPYGVLPTPAHLEWHDREVMAIVHWGPNTYTGQEWGFGDVDPARVTPDALDPEQWVKAMADGGIRAVVLVCKHHDGFCLWPSPLNKDYSMSAVPGKYKGFDVTKATEKACRKYGLAFGAYLSPWDRRQGNYGKPEYVEYFHKQWDELMTKYGDICEIWLDGANGGDGWYGGVNGGKGEKRSIPAGYYQKKRLLANLHKKHPKGVAFGGHHNWSIKWCGNEKGFSPETWWNPGKGDDGEEYWLPSEADTPFRQGWFFHGNQQPKSLEKLIQMYFESVGRGAVLNLGIAPDQHGLVCDADVKRLKEFGDWMRSFNAVDYASGARRTSKADGDNLSLEVELAKKATFNCVDFREKIELGQRVESFTVEVDDGTGWREVGKGTTVGHRRLVQFSEVTASKVRVNLKGRAAPQMHPIAVRYAAKAGEAGPSMEDAPSPDLLSKKGWMPFGKGAKAAMKKAFDDDASTLWVGNGRAPQDFAVDCGKIVTMRGFEYLPRQDGKLDGLVDSYVFEVSENGRKWREVSSGEIGNLAANPIRTRIEFEKPVKARYFRFKAMRSLGDGKTCAVAEIDLW